MTTLTAIKRAVAKRKSRGVKRSEIYTWLNDLRKRVWKNNPTISESITNLIKEEVHEAIK